LKEVKNNGLIVFVKNAIEGQVKTRLAKTIGQGQALSVYLYMQKYLANLLSGVLSFEIYIFYSDFLTDQPDAWSGPNFKKRIQKGNDLGERMNNALDQILPLHQNVLLVGSDIAGLNLTILEEGFQRLNHFDTVLGPAQDGGYYLIGMKHSHPYIFQKMTWSHKQVMAQTIEKITELGLNYSLLPVLSDVDTYEDWVNHRHLFDS